MKIEAIYRYFMMSPVSHLPVVGEDGNLKGLLSKKKLMLEMSDLAIADRDFEQIPKDFLDKEMSEELLQYFQKHKLIPVLSIHAEKKESWDKPRFLAEYSRFTEKEVPLPQEEPRQQEKNSAAIQWYMELVLQGFPDAMFATDIDGNSVFYNEPFENTVLVHPLFRNSIQFAERYLRDMNRDLVGKYLQQHELEDLGVLQTYFKNINMVLRIITLKNNNKLAGYLYHFIKSEKRNLEENGKMFPSVADAYSSALPLEKILEQVEKTYIEYSLKDNENNISHSAEKLGIPRTTLQNRMKFLKIRVESEIPIPRKRSSRKTPVVAKKDRKNKAIGAKKTSKKSISPAAKKTVEKKLNIKSKKKTK